MDREIRSHFGSSHFGSSHFWSRSSTRYLWYSPSTNPFPLLVYAMASGFAKKGAARAGTNPSKIIHECRATSGCTGTCPLKVIVHKAHTNEPATCKICGEEYTVPTWAKSLFGKPNNSGGSSRTSDTKVTRLEKQNADLQKQLRAAKAGKELNCFKTIVIVPYGWVRCRCGAENNPYFTQFNIFS